MKLTRFEQIDLMRRSCAINGTTQTELAKLLKSTNKADESKVDAVCKVFAQLKSTQMLKKLEARLDKGSNSLIKTLATKLTPYEEYIAQTKKPESARSSAWIKRIFSKKTATQAEAIALLSHSCMSVMKPIDPFTAEVSHATSDAMTVNSANAFCKRFNLK